MPYRSILITLVTTTLALLAAGLWMRAISPLLMEVNASTQPSTEPGELHPGMTVPATAAAHQPERPDRQFKALIKAVMIATMLVITLLFVIGLFTTFRAWMRSPTRNKKTRYVDAWKIAGERMEADRAADESGDDTGPG